MSAGCNSKKAFGPIVPWPDNRHLRKTSLRRTMNIDTRLRIVAIEWEKNKGSSSGIE
jgi:hypothetical protein